MLFSLVLGQVWSGHLDLPSEEFRSQYVSAVWFFCLSALICLCAEPFYVVGQTYLRVEFRAAADLCFAVLNTLLQCVVVTVWPEKAVLYGSYAHVVNSAVFLLVHVWYFCCRPHADMPFDSARDFLPTFGPFVVDKNRWLLSLSFFKQGFLKQLLTEGEKYMFTYFSLMSLSEQGVYDVIANLGSIPARLLFSKMEESAHLYFSHTVTRGRKADMSKEEEPSRHLHTLLKGLILLGLLVTAFGWSYARLLLQLYGGELLSSGVGPALMRAHCVYVIFLAVNGISECYAFACMTAEEVLRYNHLLGLMTVTFLASTWILAKMFGPVGFAAANIVNFIMRIIHNMWVIKKRHSNSAVKPLRNLAPSLVTMLVLCLSACVCQWSEYRHDASLGGSIKHISIGAIAFGITLATIGLSEGYINRLFKRKLKRA